MKPHAFALLLALGTASMAAPNDSIKPPAPKAAARWTIDAGLRLGSQYGDLRTEDEDFYRMINLGVGTQSTGYEPIELGVFAAIFEIAAYREMQENLWLGLGASTMSSSSEPSNAKIKDASKDFIERKALTLRGRWIPLEQLDVDEKFSLEVEPAIGMAFGTFHRIALAAAEIDQMKFDSSISLQAQDNFKEFIALVNKPISATGLHLELFVNATKQLGSGLRYGLGLGVTYTAWQPDADPVARANYFTTSPKDIGFSIRGTLGFGR